VIQIDADACWAFARCDTAEERAWLQSCLTFHDPKALYSKGPSQVCLLSAIGRFPAGLAHMVRGLGADAGIQVKIVRPAPWREPPDISTAEGAEAAGVSWLRSYQLDALRQWLKARRGHVEAPVGAGKTEILAGAVKLTGGRWVLIAHSAGLVDQGAERTLKRTGVPIGEVSSSGVVTIDGVPCDDPAQAVIIPVTQQWLHRNLKFVKGRPINEALAAFCASAHGLCVDEAHRLGADTLFEVVMQFSGTSWRLGLSGTMNEQGPLRAARAIGAIGVIVSSIDNKELIDQGHVAAGKVHMIPVGHHTPRAQTWQGVYLETVVRSKVRAKVVADVIERAAKPCMVFVDDISNGHLAATAVAARERGVNTATVDGRVPEWARKKTIESLRRGDYDCIVCTEVFQEGVDIPELASVIVATGGKSAVAAIQRMGRATRVTDSKRTFELYDVYDYVVGSDADSPAKDKWCENHARARARAYVSEGHKVVVGPLDGPTELYHNRWRPR